MYRINFCMSYLFILSHKVQVDRTQENRKFEQNLDKLLQRENKWMRRLNQAWVWRCSWLQSANAAIVHDVTELRVLWSSETDMQYILDSRAEAALSHWALDSILSGASDLQSGPDRLHLHCYLRSWSAEHMGCTRESYYLGLPGCTVSR